MMVPAIMYGRRLPNLEVQLSANTPTSGCITKPERGPATNTIAIFDFDKPSERRYGEAYDISTLQKIWIPKKPTVKVGICDHFGPMIFDTPLNFWWLWPFPSS